MGIVAEVVEKVADIVGKKSMEGYGGGGREGAGGAGKATFCQRFPICSTLFSTLFQLFPGEKLDFPSPPPPRASQVP